ncbi:serine/threonine protein kinase [Saprospira sp. CCB-QB6]|uniref:protein kinase domain-containing protein n=1 Tax=Saprospira sp. CCB-QB6 TaxID=3023936 RepID=UPI00234B08E1|nr:serine/threonine protein kinase [Saprospira sp. CCB-QB6]WCL81117.1 serine/threonine protein kinase [Saprospira sp. CCB-QB6]
MEENNSQEQVITLFLSETGEALSLAPKAFASGGEGSLFHILSPEKYSNRVAKIYHPHKRTAEKLAKLEILIKDPLAQGQEGVAPSFIWPEALLQNEKGEQIGLMMPLAQGKKLELLCLPKLPRKIDAAWKRLAFDQADSLKFRLKIAFNLVNALRQLQKRKKYVLVDLKAENILVQTNGQISIVDVDSLQISDGNQFFKAAVATPEYSAPEYYEEPKIKRFKASWDNFALAVILYKLFLGIHPFAASAKGKYESRVSLHEKIEAGLYVHHPKAKEWLKFLPPPHQKYAELPQGLQNLFTQTFVKGLHQAEKRARPEEWCTELLREIGGWALIFDFEEMKALEEIKRLELSEKEISLPEEKELEELQLFPAGYQTLFTKKKDFLDEATLTAPSGCLNLLGYISYLPFVGLCIATMGAIFFAFEGWLYLLGSLVGAFFIYVFAEAFAAGKSPRISSFLSGAGKLGAIALILWSFSLFSVPYLYDLFDVAYWGIWTISNFALARILTSQEENKGIWQENLGVLLQVAALGSLLYAVFYVFDYAVFYTSEGASILFPELIEIITPYTLFALIGFFIGWRLKKASTKGLVSPVKLIDDYNKVLGKLQLNYETAEQKFVAFASRYKDELRDHLQQWFEQWKTEQSQILGSYQNLLQKQKAIQQASQKPLLDKARMLHPLLRNVQSFEELKEELFVLEKIVAAREMQEINATLLRLLQEYLEQYRSYLAQQQEEYEEARTKVADLKTKLLKDYQKEQEKHFAASEDELQKINIVDDLSLNTFVMQLEEIHLQKEKLIAITENN